MNYLEKNNCIFLLLINIIIFLNRTNNKIIHLDKIYKLI